MSSATDRGRFVWYDYMTGDPAGAIDFYTRVVGWGTQLWESSTGGPSYTMWTAGGAPIGGIIPFGAQMPADTPPHWLAYVCVPDVEETARQVTALGGKILLAPITVPGVGKYLTFADPQGAVIAAYTPESDVPARDGLPKIGEFSWHELTTTDHVHALEFYSALFGWNATTSMDMGAMGTYQLYGRDGADLGGMFNGAPEMPLPPHWMLYVTVDDADAAITRVKTNGGTVLNGPMEVPGGNQVAQCMDPAGGLFAVNAFPKVA